VTIPRNPAILPLVLLAFTLLLQVWAFQPSMNGEFIADDLNLIVEKADLFGDPSRLGQAFSEPYWVRTRESLPFYRPLVLVTFFTDRALSGFEPFGYHLTNLLLHLANGLLVYLLGLSLTRSHFQSLAASMIFGLHPAHLTSVAWISGRTDLLVLLFLLAAALLFIRGCREDRGGWGWIAGSGGCFLFALLSKEMGLILLPFTLIWLIGEGRWRTGWRRWIPLAGICAVYWLMRWCAGAGSVEISGTTAPLVQRIITMPALFLYYLKLFLWPADWNFAPRQRSTAHGVIFGLLALAPVMGLVPLYASVREWWGYTATAGLALALAPLPVWLSGLPRPAWGRKTVVLLLLLPALAAVGVLHQRSGAFATAGGFWQEAVDRAPEWDVGWNYLGLTLQVDGHSEEAARCFTRAMALRPDVADYPNNLGLINAMKGRMGEAERLFRLSLRIDPAYEDPCNNLGLLLTRQGRLDEAEPWLLKALELEPDNIMTLNNLATLYIRSGEPERAVGPASRSLALDPGQAGAERLRSFLSTPGARAGQSR